MQTASSVQEAIDWAKSGQQSMVKCPAHDDGNASLHVAPGSTQPVVMTCHAQCQLEDILMAGQVDMQSLLAERDPNDTRAGTDNWTPAGPASHVYPYHDEQGRTLFEVLRIPLANGKKEFRQRHPDASERSGWKWNMQDVRRVIYRLPDVLRAINEGHTIFIVEGEKDADNMRARGYCATTSPMGAGKWRDEYTQFFAGASSVVIIADQDSTGRAHARKVKEDLATVGVDASIKETANGTKDISDHFAKGLDLDSLLETAPGSTPKRANYGTDVLEAIKRVFEEKSYVIPNILARGDRLLVTGFEGHGKSTLFRQFAVQCAAGIHPFTGLPMPRQKVVFADCENHPDQVLTSWQDLVGLARRHGGDIDPGGLTILEEWDSEIDLTSEEGKAWLIERVHAYQPDIMFIGPLYNMSGRDLKDDETVRKIKHVVNEARGICGTAFVMEHHAPHRNPNDKERSVRPYGSSTFLKWPDFGYGLRPLEQKGAYEWQKTRFPRVRSRAFPSHLRWGTPGTIEWPWMPAAEDANGNIV